MMMWFLLSLLLCLLLAEIQKKNRRKKSYVITLSFICLLVPTHAKRHYQSYPMYKYINNCLSYTQALKEESENKKKKMFNQILKHPTKKENIFLVFLLSPSCAC